ncbi:MAG: hypothetical protein L6437_13790 [Kiritimatiellae bacterium]|nr:hypothetical protein [Kiritimatiellia bacterium]MCG2680678.1 hypothetical protein [Kiritimatiellia bacterium]
MKTKKQKVDTLPAKTADKARCDDIRSLVCPKCGVLDRIAAIDIIPGYAKILGAKADGSLEWAGETEVDWDMQRPASNPREFVCLACNEKFGGVAIGI